jgi:hypothetical protein
MGARNLLSLPSTRPGQSHTHVRRRGHRHVEGNSNFLTCPIAKHEINGREHVYLGLSGLLAHFNNEHGWRRERIADWLAAHGF